MYGDSIIFHTSFNSSLLINRASRSEIFPDLQTVMSVEECTCLRMSEIVLLLSIVNTMRSWLEPEKPVVFIGRLSILVTFPNMECIPSLVVRSLAVSNWMIFLLSLNIDENNYFRL